MSPGMESYCISYSFLVFPFNTFYPLPLPTAIISTCEHKQEPPLHQKGQNPDKEAADEERETSEEEDGE